MRQLLCILSMAAFCAAAAPAQSLGDVARAERLRKASAPSAPRVITNDDIATAPAHESPATDPSQVSQGEANEKPEPLPAKTAERKQRPDAKQVQQTIRVQKQKVLALEAHAKQVQDRLDARESVGAPVAARVLLQGQGVGHSGAGLCPTSAAMYTNPYKDWCEEPEKLRADLKKTQAELEKERGKLEAMQEEARKAGFGSVIYDPD
jgi:hypothetical protein